MSAAGDKVPPGLPQPQSGYYPVRVQKKVPTNNLINDLGHYGGLHVAYRNEDLINLELKSVEALVNLSKVVNLANESQHLIVRDIFPDRDFVDGNGNAISGRAWRQPWSGFYTTLEQDVCIYKINRQVDYHNKCYAFWGLTYVDRGVADTDPVTDCTSITIKDSVNTFDIWHTEQLDNNKSLFCFKPIIIKNYTEYSIWVRPNISGGQDNIQILGKICEPAGETIMGSPIK